jgi:hypothetical protein
MEWRLSMTVYGARPGLLSKNILYLNEFENCSILNSDAQSIILDGSEFIWILYCRHVLMFVVAHFLFLNSRMNMSAFGVKVLCLEPGFFKTSVTDLNLLRKNVKTLWDNLSEEIKDQYGHDYPERGTVKNMLFTYFSLNKQIYT